MRLDDNWTVETEDGGPYLRQIQWYFILES